MGGFHFFMTGFRLVMQSRIRRFVYIPLLINAILFICIWGVSGHFFAEFTAWLNHDLPSWLHWLSGLFWLVYIVLGLLMTAYIFTWLANLIAAPFYGLLSERIQQYLTGEPLPDMPWFSVVADVPKALTREWQKLIYYLPRALGLLVLSVIPGINLLVAILWFLFGSWMQSLQYIDYPMDNNHQTFDGVKTWLSAHKTMSFSFGLSVMVAMMVPVINIVVMPAAVAGATAMLVHSSKR